MKIYFLAAFFVFGCYLNNIAQSTYENKITNVVNVLLNTLPQTGVQKVVICLDANAKENWLNPILDDIIFEISTKTNDNLKIIDFINKDNENNIVAYLAKNNIANFLIIIRPLQSETENKVQFKLVNCFDGYVLKIARESFVKKILNTDSNNNNLSPQNRELQTTTKVNTSILNDEQNKTLPKNIEAPIKIEKPKRENRFLKALGTAAGNILVGITTPKSASSSSNTKNESSTEQSSTNSNSTNTNGATDGAGNMPTEIPKPCNSNVLFINNTENALSLTVYTDNPIDNSNAKKHSVFSLDIDGTKKIKIEKGIKFYYIGTNNTGAPVFGGYKTYNGDFESEACGETIEEPLGQKSSNGQGTNNNPMPIEPPPPLPISIPSNSCKSYVVFANNSENAVAFTIYTENPLDNSSAKKFSIFTLEPSNKKKIKIEKDIKYYFTGTNNTGAPIFGGYKNYSGDFESDTCDELIEEEIK